MDRLTKEQRHKNMQAVKNKDSQIELMLRSALWNKGYRYRKTIQNLRGNLILFCRNIKQLYFVIVNFGMGITGRFVKRYKV